MAVEAWINANKKRIVHDIIGVIEVMKQFTEIHADAGGKILRFLVDNDAPIESGQPVLLIEIA